MWKDFFYFSLAERRGVIFIVVLIVLVCFAGWFIPNRSETESEHNSTNLKEEYAQFLNALEQTSSDKSNYTSSKYSKKQKEVVLADFDPNAADSLQFSSLGLPGWMITNIQSYRNKGGNFKKPEDFSKIYGLKEEQYLALLPYIQIAPIEKGFRDTLKLLAHEAKKDTFPKQIKYSPGTIIGLNSADTTQLKMIPGVGSTIARMIVKHRDQLGGYFSTSQLEEIHLKADLLAKWFEVEQDSIHLLAINKLGLERLRKHPYINFYQAKAIVEHKKKRGNIKSLDDLKLYEEFSQDDLERLKHYFSFD